MSEKLITMNQLKAVAQKNREVSGEVAAAATEAIEELSSAFNEALNAIPGIQQVSIILPAADWTDNTETVAVSGVSADNSVFPSPAPESWESAGQCGIRCTAQGDGNLTFACAATPADNLNYNVLIIGVV